MSAGESDRGGTPPRAPLPPAEGFLAIIRNGLTVIGPDRKRLTASIGLALVVGFLETALLYMVAAIAIAMSGSRTLVRLGPERFGLEVSLTTACQVGLALVLVLLLLSIPLARLMASLSTRAMMRLRGRMVEAYLNSTITYRESQREGLLQQLVGEYALRAENSVQQLSLAVVAMAMFAMVVAGAIASAPLVALGMIGALILCGALFAPIARRIRQNANSPILTNREIVGRVAQASRMGQEIAAYDVAVPVSQQLEGGIAEAATAMGKLRFEARLMPNLFQYGAIGLIFVFVAVLAQASPGQLGGLAPLALLLVRALTYVRQLQRSLHTAREMGPYIAAIEQELATLEGHVPPEGTVACDGFGGLRFRNVSYAYKPGEPALRAIDFAIEPGEMVGIVGPSGSGKSTLTGLMLRLRMPMEGRILVGETPLADLTAASWARLTGYVPQESRLLYGTVADNIRLFRQGFDEASVIRAAQAAHVHDEILALPEGYATLIGPGARGLSGGQAQRLSIARALLASPRLIIMDEPTSALDARSEQLVGQTLSELKGSSTIILVAHRPATLELCDRILEVREGSLRELTAMRTSDPH